MKIVYAFIIIIIFIINLFKLIFNFTLQDLKSPSMFANEICSYNGNFDIKTQTCTCQAEYANDPLNTNKINGIPVQCSYQRKRRFIAVFFSIFLPFGMDYLYLNRYAVCLLIIIVCCFTLLGNCYRFAVSPTTGYIKFGNNYLFILLALCVFIGGVINIVLILIGVIKDGNGIETVDDLNFLINLNSNN